MKVICRVGDVRMEVPVGPGKQHIRWLALVVATRMQRERYPHAFRVPQRVLKADGTPLKEAGLAARQVISDVLKDGDEVIVELRPGPIIPEEEEEAREWVEESYGLKSNLMECKIKWVQPPGKGAAPLNLKAVKGNFVVAPRWQAIYPQREFGGPFEITIDYLQIDSKDADMYEWVASMQGPPGRCTYKFVLDNDREIVCKDDVETLTGDKSQHEKEFFWDVPLAPTPEPEIDSRPSTASSRDGAQVDPRFEQDWEAMRLRWVNSFMKVRVKDVLTEFYAILIDLFDSYAFMGLDLSANQHTVGMDDWQHLVINCGLLHGQPEGSLTWREACAWFEEAMGVKDARPYYSQRLSRSVYLELLMRLAGWAMCEHPRPQYAPEPGRNPMPLDEGLFRFITDILIPVMDVYDEDPIRKDAVIHENLIVIQQNRSSIRSLYAFLGQPWPYCDGEKVVVPSTLRFVFEYVLESLEAEEPPPEAAPADPTEVKEAESGPHLPTLLGGEDKLDPAQLKVILKTLEATIEQVTANHPEGAEDRALLFWEFFEVLLQACRELVAASSPTPLVDGIPALVQTLLAFMGLVDQGYVSLPEVAKDFGGEPDEDPEEE